MNSDEILMIILGGAFLVVVWIIFSLNRIRKTNAEEDRIKRMYAEESHRRRY